jgi:serine/threonine-protein phosphatase 4 regulatory subunit 2
MAALGVKHALGLVDELDDPGPGHLSERPTAISSVTTVEESGPLSLEARFTKASEKSEEDRGGSSENEKAGGQEASGAEEQDGDKENKT